MSRFLSQFRARTQRSFSDLRQPPAVSLTEDHAPVATVIPEYNEAFELTWTLHSRYVLRKEECYNPVRRRFALVQARTALARVFLADVLSLTHQAISEINQFTEDNNLRAIEYLQQILKLAEPDYHSSEESEP